MARAQGPVEEVIRRRVAEHPDAAWLLWKDTEFSWREVLSNSLRAANGLLELGVRPGERVAILMGNRPEFMAQGNPYGYPPSMPPGMMPPGMIPPGMIPPGMMPQYAANPQYPIAQINYPQTYRGPQPPNPPSSVCKMVSLSMA